MRLHSVLVAASLVASASAFVVPAPKASRSAGTWAGRSMMLDAQLLLRCPVSGTLGRRHVQAVNRYFWECWID